MFVYSDDIFITNRYISDLEQKATDALNVAKQLENFKTDTEVSKKLSGEVFNLLLKNIEMYQHAFKKISELSLILANNIKASNNGFLNYTFASPIGEPIDMRKIPEFEEEKKAKEKERDYCLEMITVEQKDSSGKVVGTITKQRDPERAAVLQEEIKKLQEIIDYLNRLPNEDGQASSKIETISTDISKNNNDISSIEVSRV